MGVDEITFTVCNKCGIVLKNIITYNYEKELYVFKCPVCKYKENSKEVKYFKEVYLIDVVGKERKVD